MKTRCFLLGHKKEVQEDEKTTLCKRCGYKELWKKGYAEIGVSFTQRSNGVLGFVSEPMNWVPFITIFIGFKLLAEIK